MLAEVGEFVEGEFNGVVVFGVYQMLLGQLRSLEVVEVEEDVFGVIIRNQKAIVSIRVKEL